jgi:hypothetical protein
MGKSRDIQGVFFGFFKVLMGLYRQWGQREIWLH